LHFRTVGSWGRVHPVQTQNHSLLIKVAEVASSFRKKFLKIKECSNNSRKKNKIIRCAVQKKEKSSRFKFKIGTAPP
jgi:hypothetical protein